MYKHIIEIKSTVSEERLKELLNIASRKFDNRAGKVLNVSNEPYLFIFEGGEADYGCMNIGMLDLWDNKDFLSDVKDWNWIDEEEPDESCNVIEELSIPVK